MLVAGNFSKTDGAYTVTFPVTGKWYDYLTGDEVEVKDARQIMEFPAHSFRSLTTFPCLNSLLILARLSDKFFHYHRVPCRGGMLLSDTTKKVYPGKFNPPLQPTIRRLLQALLLRSV